MGQIALVVWREGVEALLVVGVLNAWLTHVAASEARAGRLALWTGALVGLVFATALGAVLLFASDIFGDEGEDYFQAAMALLAAGLVVQMVGWSHRRGREWTVQLQNGATAAVHRSNWFGIALLAALAIAREGSETVVFLYGNFASATGEALFWGLTAAGLGLIAALLTYGLIQLGGKFVSWRLFFKVTEVLMLLVAAALFMTGVDRLIGLGVLPLLTPLWDSSAVLDDSSPLGSFVSSLTGYRARPDLVLVLAYCAFWAVAWLVTRAGRRVALTPKTT